MDKREETTSTSSEEEIIPRKKLSTKDTTTGLYIIYSKWSLCRISRELDFHGKIGLLRIICDSGKETNRTLALLENEVYDKLSKKGYTDKKSNRGFSIARFNEKALDLPSKGFTKNLFIYVPEVFRKNDVETIDIIDEKLKHLVGWEILPKDSWHVNTVLKSREKGAISSGCFIVFDNDVEIAAIAKTKLLITDTFWPKVADDLEREPFKCLWAKKKEQKKKVEDDSKEKDGKKYIRKIKSEEKDDDEVPKRKIRSEEKDDDCEIPKRKIKSEEKDKKKSKDKEYRLKDRSKDTEKIVNTIPVTFQPVEIVDDKVETIPVTVQPVEIVETVTIPVTVQPVEIVDDIVGTIPV